MKINFKQEMEWLIENIPIHEENRERNPQILRAYYNPKNGHRIFLVDINFITMRREATNTQYNWDQQAYSQADIKKFQEEGMNITDIRLRVYEEYQDYAYDYAAHKEIKNGTKLRKNSYFRFSQLQEIKFSFGMGMEIDEYFQSTKIETIRRKMRKESRE